MARFRCIHCGKECKTENGLRQHQDTNRKCLRARQESLEAQARAEEPEDGSSMTTSSGESPSGNVDPPASRRTGKRTRTMEGGESHARRPTRRSQRVILRQVQENVEEEQAIAMQEDPEVGDGDGSFDHGFGGGGDSVDMSGGEVEQDGDGSGPPRQVRIGLLNHPETDSDDDDARHNDSDEEEEEERSQSEQNKEDFEPSDMVFKAFKGYVNTAELEFPELTVDEMACIRIMYKLIKKKATLDTYEVVMEWHLRESGKLLPQQKLSDSKHFISRYRLMKMLRERYNTKELYAKPVTKVLPHSRAKVTIYRRHARDLVRSLLTHPRWTDEDWLFFDNDPFAGPPENLKHVADINTGKAYLETYKKLITKPNQILVALPTYIDGAVTGQFDKLQVTALKMTIGILNNNARNKEYAWRTLGLVPNYTKADQRGQRIFLESGHLATEDMFGHDEFGEALVDEDNIDQGEDVDKAADYHTILEVLLETMRELIDEGMVMDIHYRGKLHKNCELVFFMPFVKCDGDEGDKLCLSMRSRGKHISQLCRYCQCPNDKTDDPQDKSKYKTEPMLRKLYEANNQVKLKQMSQINAKNAFHGLRFGLHDKRGIHGACPWEMLHAILLGIFVYVRDCLFMQVGKTSKSASDLNGLSKILGSLISRQSDRNKPRTKLGNGVAKGKLMAKEFTGVMLILSAMLRVQAGVDLFRTARKKNFREEWQRRDWILLIETMLQWEAYLNLPEMDIFDLRRLKRKNRFLMFLLKKIANRTKKMGFKLMKFHAILHLVDDILNFGVPSVVDTGSNESHHKLTKVAAKLTQKDIKNFEKQTSERLDDFHTLELAMEEVEEPSRPLWEYWDGYSQKEVEAKDPVTRTGGMKWTVLQEAAEEAPKVKILSRMQNKDRLQMADQLLEVLWKIQQKVAHLLPIVHFFTEHQRNNVIFRSHPNFLGKGPWRDWVMVQWQVGNALLDYPAQIWGFADLSELLEDAVVEYDDDTTLTSNVYAIVESGELVVEDTPLSDLWQPIHIEVAEQAPNGQVVKRKFYIVDVNTFKEPLCVIPNLGSNNPCEYLRMTPRVRWSEDFRQWLHAPHDVDEVEMAEEEANQHQEEDQGEDQDEGSGSEEEPEEEGDDDEENGDSETDDDQDAGSDEE